MGFVPRPAGTLLDGTRIVELDGRAEVDTDEPTPFAVSTLEVHRRFGVSVLGGCCGTDDRHIAAIAAGLTAPGELAPR
jgi:homocysteine S-methyltransferase